MQEGMETEIQKFAEETEKDIEKMRKEGVP